MKIIRGEGPEKDPNTGKKKISIEIDEDDIILLEEIVRKYEQDGNFDKDDTKIKQKIKHNKEQLHEAFKIVRPS